MSDTKTIFGMLVFLMFIGVCFGLVATLFIKTGAESGVGACAEFDLYDTDRWTPPEPTGNWLYDSTVFPVQMGIHMIGMLFHPCMRAVTWFYMIIFISLMVAILVKLVRG